MQVTKRDGGCGGEVLQIDGYSIYVDGTPCSATPNMAITGAFPLVQGANIQQSITIATGITAAVTSFLHSDGNTYLRVNNCAVYKYTQDTSTTPYLGVSLATPIVMAHGYGQTSICAPPPPSPPHPPESPAPSPPCACSNTCAGLRDDGGAWTRNGVTEDSDGSSRILQTAQGGWCDTTVDGACLMPSSGGSAPVSYSNNGICEDGGSGSVSNERYYMCQFHGGDLDTPYCTNTRDNGGVVNHGLNQWWLPCALGTDCSDCGIRCGQNAVAASAIVSLDTPRRIRFDPDTITLRPGEHVPVTVYIDEPLLSPSPPAALSVGLASGNAQVSVSPAIVSWTAANWNTGRVFILTAANPLTTSGTDTATVTVTSNSEYYFGYVPTFTLNVAGSPPSAPPIAPISGCAQNDAYHNPVTSARCQEYFLAYSLNGRGTFSEASGADTAKGICYYEHDTHNVVFAPLSQAHLCRFTEYECFCHGTPPPPPPPGTCGTDYCNCALAGAALGGSAICPGASGCAIHPNSCMATWNSVCTENVCGPTRFEVSCAARSANVWCLRETGLQQDGLADCASDCASGLPPPSPAYPPGMPAPPRVPIGSG